MCFFVLKCTQHQRILVIRPGEGQMSFSGGGARGTRLPGMIASITVSIACTGQEILNLPRCCRGTIYHGTPGSVVLWMSCLCCASSLRMWRSSCSTGRQTRVGNPGYIFSADTEFERVNRLFERWPKALFTRGESAENVSPTQGVALRCRVVSLTQGSTSGQTLRCNTNPCVMIQSPASQRKELRWWKQRARCKQTLNLWPQNPIINIYI